MIVFVLTAHFDNDTAAPVFVGVFSSDDKALAHAAKGQRDYITMHREFVDEPFVFGDEEPVEVWRRK